MEILDDDLLDIGTGKQKLEDFISKIICHSTKNEFAVGKNHPYSIPFRILLSINKSIPCIFFLNKGNNYLSFSLTADTAKSVLIRNTHKKQNISILQKLKSRKKYSYNIKKSEYIPKKA